MTRLQEGRSCILLAMMRVGLQRERVDTVRGWVLCATVFLCPVAYSFHLVSFLHPKELVLALGLCVMAALVLARGSWTWAGLRAFLPLWVLLAVGAVAHLGLGLARVPSYTVIELDRVGLLLLAPALGFDLLRRPVWRRRVTNALVASCAAVAVLGLLQYAKLILFMFPEFPGYNQRAYSVFGNQDLFGSYLAVGYAIALIGILRGRRIDKLCAVALPILVAGLLISGSRSAWLAAAAATCLAIFMARRRPRRVAAVLLGMVAVGAALVPMAPEATLGRISSALGDGDVGLGVREWIWNGAALMVRDHPVLGVGPGNFSYWSPRYLGEALHAPGGERLYRNELFAVHAESEPVEILSETGVVGALLCLWMLGRVARRRGPEWVGLTALLATSLFSFPLHSAPHALAGVLLAGMLLSRRRRLVEGRGARWVAALAFPLATLFVWAVFVPSALLRTAEDAQLAHEPALELYERAVRWPWPNPHAHAHYGYALGENQQVEGSIRQMELALRGLDTGDLYYGLGAMALRLRDYDAAERWFRECVYRWPSQAQARELLERAQRLRQSTQ